MTDFAQSQSAEPTALGGLTNDPPSSTLVGNTSFDRNVMVGDDRRLLEGSK